MISYTPLQPANSFHLLRGLRALAKAVIPKAVRSKIAVINERWFTNYSRKSYAQEGEDLILERFLENRPNGFYVDVGAHHPERFSNTYRLYCKGWKGINIDAIPGSMALFRQRRPRDINVEAAVAASTQELTFYLFNESALNTFNKLLAMERISGRYKIIKEISLTTRPLSEILDEHVPPGIRLDVLTVDVEGFDYDVLVSNDWDRYRPEFVLAECLGAMTEEDTKGESIYKFLCQHGYRMVAKTMNTVVFRCDKGRMDNLGC